MGHKTVFLFFFIFFFSLPFLWAEVRLMAVKNVLLLLYILYFGERARKFFVFYRYIYSATRTPKSCCTTNSGIFIADTSLAGSKGTLGERCDQQVSCLYSVYNINVYQGEDFKW